MKLISKSGTTKRSPAAVKPEPKSACPFRKHLSRKPVAGQRQPCSSAVASSPPLQSRACCPSCCCAVASSRAQEHPQPSCPRKERPTAPERGAPLSTHRFLLNEAHRTPSIEVVLPLERFGDKTAPNTGAGSQVKVQEPRSPLLRCLVGHAPAWVSHSSADGAF